MSQKRLTLLLLYLTAGIFTQAQVVNDLISPAPNSAGLARFAEIPVELNTGVPNIELPLLVAKGRQLSLPIGLSYHASGLKVNDYGGWVGLGWSLNAGGIITRVLRGRPDESTYGFFQYASSIPDYNGTISLSDKTSLADGTMDMVPDLYYYNIGQDAGKMIFGNDLLPKTLPKKDLKITVSSTSDLANFTIVAADGTIFQFNTSESTHINVRNNPSYKSTWYLSRIISADRSDTISLFYKTTSNYSYTAAKNAVQKIYYDVPYGATKPYGISSDYTYETVTAQAQDPKMLDSIICANGKIKFKTSTRADLTDAQRLDSVTFYRRDPITKTFKFEKKVILYYDGGLINTRLVLDSVREYRSGAYYPATKFVYNGGPPDVGTDEADYGGYFNDVANTNPLPSFVFGNTVYNEGNSRIPDSTVVANGVLKQVTSPAGGVTTYKFESNTYSFAATVDTLGHINLPELGTYYFIAKSYPYDTLVNLLAPGLRIKRITQTDPFSNIQAITNYEYSGGILAYQPSYFTTLPVKDVVGGNTYNYNCFIARSNPIGDGASGGPPVMYRYVKVYHGNDKSVAGKTVSKFDLAEQTTAGYPYTPNESDFSTTGRLLELKHYSVVDTTGTLVKKTVNTYTTDSAVGTIKGLKAAYNKIIFNTTATSSDFDIENYFAYTKFNYLSKSENYDYEQSSGTLSALSTQDIYYEKTNLYFQPTKIKTQTSESSTALQKEFTYPLDYSGGVFTTMQNLHMVSYPVEVKSVLIQGSSEYITGYQKTDYSEWTTSRVYPQYAYGSKIASPVLRNTFNSSPSSYLRRTSKFNQYNTKGVLTESEPEGGIPSALIYDQYLDLATAQITAARSNQVAFTSFESADFGQWTVSNGTAGITGTDYKTGTHSLLLTSVTVSKTSLPAGDYFVSYFQKGGTATLSVTGGASVASPETNSAEADGWTLIKQTVHISATSDAIQITGTSIKIDELRLYPVGSLITTTCFDAKGRPVTVTDVNHRSAFYEYDIWGRKTLDRDHDRNILRKYEYKLKGN